MMSSGALLAVAWCACFASVALLGCDTPPVSPSSAGAPTIAPAHASPDPPPARQVIVEDAGVDAGRADAGSLDAGGGLGDVDGGAMDADGGGEARPRSGALSKASESVLTEVARAEVSARRPAFRACYTFNPRPLDRGRVVLRANIGADGTVQTVMTRDTQGVSGRIVTCLVDVLKGTRFPDRGHAATFDVPLSYRTVY
jgi:hypothetical protein